MKPAGFWIRFAASIIDAIVLTLSSWLVLAVILFLLKFSFDLSEVDALVMQMADFVVYAVFSLVYYTLMHEQKGTTLGKMLFHIYVVDHETGEFLSLGRSLIRTLGYTVSAIPLMAGYVMAAFQPEKRALHDIISGSRSVIRKS